MPTVAYSWKLDQNTACHLVDLNKNETRGIMRELLPTLFGAEFNWDQPTLRTSSQVRHLAIYTFGRNVYDHQLLAWLRSVGEQAGQTFVPATALDVVALALQHPAVLCEYTAHAPLEFVGADGRIYYLGANRNSRRQVRVELIARNQGIGFGAAEGFVVRRVIT